MFEHSVKVPRHYKIAAGIFKKVATEGGSVKSLLYDDKLRHFRTNVLYALITEAIKHAAEIDRIFELTSILIKEPRLDPWLAKVLSVELLFGKKALPGKSKPEQTIMSYKEQFQQLSTESDQPVKEVIRRPRYVRINTNLTTTSDVIRTFQDEDYRFIRCTSGSYNDYLEQVKKLEEYDFMQDFHVKTLLVFTPGTRMHQHPLYLENKIILQDKATTMVAHLLAPPPGSSVLDMCAAPGMKTTHLAAYMKNEGTIYAVERSEPRYKTLLEFVERTGSTCVRTINKDVLEIKRGDYDDVEYILLDPSCSGSGMELCLHSYIEEDRLTKLTNLQEKFLKHAMNAFPKVKKIVYSTCSLYPQENERVVTNAVTGSRSKWKVLNVKDLLKDQWNNFGSGLYGSMGVRCMYARPDSDLTTGFFLAVLEKVEKGEETGFERKQKSKKDKKVDDLENNLEAAVNQERTDGNDISTNNEDNLTIKSENLIGDYMNLIKTLNRTDNLTPMKKKIKDIENSEPIEILQINDQVDVNVDIKKHKKKNKKGKEASDEVIEILDKSLELVTTDIAIKKCKKKKKDKESLDVEDVVEILDTSVEDGVTVMASKKSKKKKRQKEKVSSEEAIEVLDDLKIDDNDVTIVEEPKKKKRKRDNIVTNDNEESNPHEIVNNASENNLNIEVELDAKKVNKAKKKNKKNNIHE